MIVVNENSVKVAVGLTRLQVIIRLVNASDARVIKTVPLRATDSEFVKVNVLEFPVPVSSEVHVPVDAVIVKSSAASHEPASEKVIGNATVRFVFVT